MATMNDSGWSPIHHATFKNHLTLVERLIESSGYEHLEKKTNDTLQNTPLLLAVARGSGPMVKLLVNHGADVTYLNTCRQGVIEISTLFGHVNLIKYFISLHNKNLNVYKKLVALVDQDSEDGVNRACFIISKLTSLAEDQESICHLSNFVDEGLVFQLVDVLKKSIAENVKIQTLNVLKPILGNKNVRKKMMEVEGFQVFVSLIFSSSALLLPAVMGCICELATDKDFEEDLLATVIPALNKVVSSLGQGNQEDVLQSILNVLDHLAAVSAVCKDTIGKEAGLLGTLVKFFKTCQTNSLMLTWSEAIGSIAEGNLNNQNILLSENIGLCLHQLLKSQKREVLMSAVKTIYRLVEGNPQAQTKVLQSNNFSPLIQLLKRSKSQLTHEAIAKTLWALSGLDTETQRMVAARIGVSLLVEFLSSPSYILNLVGTRGLSVLLQGPYDLRNAVMAVNGARHLVRLLRSPREDVVLSAIQALQHICLGVGFIPHGKIQSAVASSRGLKFLIALMRHSQSERIKVEAALAIATSVLGHSENLELIGKGSGFSYSYILHLLHSSDEEVCLTAGEALATFAFKSTSQQKEIIQNGGLVWRDFAKLLESTNQNHRTSTAFQLVVLAPIISDQKPSYTCALGIQTLVGLLETTQPYDTLALAADCVARLSLTRAGLSAAMVSIDIVNLLCPLLSSPSQQVRGSASIALSHLSFNPVAERQLLQRCRRDPKLIKVLIYYNKKRKWSENFLERWRHIRELTLPPIRRTAVFVTSSDKQRNDRGNIQSSAGNQMVTLPDFLNNRQSEMRRKNHCLSV
ncbi:ankyrin and armadillo repeat-containing protein isoform X1 [Hyla sarda]|uniref:ankyrin and armadillo repeat-containing protein isoform X1 n=1 Tax=Hyla sarda TaxID=327740 RepID=UPI0024C3670F|nr:ankyrin and armadillo repeat-containing protein isoform X1 [Hyla sarda]XP_056381569.1 ankyrin and armadillo repeat-containing protein isoform X1 [Hyla sarda]XP_056381570.1 ankyrin and armadillo repeat-containing protein isoform X1 [Hyla sarda]XP_056381571.1 ankyrin and armadillo repeat-containing protein isoform X1 [Hyla sarda]